MALQAPVLIRCMHDSVADTSNAAGACAWVHWLPDVPPDNLRAQADAILAAQPARIYTAVLVAGGDGYYVAESYTAAGTHIQFCGHGALAAAWFVLHECEPAAQSVAFMSRQQHWQASRCESAAADIALLYAQPVTVACPVPEFATRCLGSQPIAAAEAGTATDYLIMEMDSVATVQNLQPDLALLSCSHSTCTYSNCAGLARCQRGCRSAVSLCIPLLCSAVRRARGRRYRFGSRAVGCLLGSALACRTRHVASAVAARRSHASSVSCRYSRIAGPGRVWLTRMGLAKQQAERRLADDFAELRAQTVVLCAGLTPEDCNLQAMPETSPAKWHLAHTTWFFETFVLEPFCAGYLPVNPLYSVLFNSYYNGIGAQYPRPQRGLLSRPTLAEVIDYRDIVSAAVIELLNDASHPDAAQIAARVELGLHHEAQHQELLLTDIKYSFFQNPLFPAYRETPHAPDSNLLPLEWLNCKGGEVRLGYRGAGFAFDNETPQHRCCLRRFSSPIGWSPMPSTSSSSRPAVTAILNSGWLMAGPGSAQNNRRSRFTGGRSTGNGSSTP